MKRYKVGMMTQVCEVEAPNAALAAMYYGLYLANTNNPFVAVVYEEDGQEWDGEPWWISIRPDVEHVKMVATRLPKEDLEHCRVIENEADATQELPRVQS